MLGIVAYLAFTVIVGTVVCFFGKKLYFPVIMFTAFAASLAFFMDKLGGQWKGVLLGTAVGIILALLVRFVYKAGVFLLGALGGSIFAMSLIRFLPGSTGSFKWVILGACMLVFGLFTLTWCDVFIMFGTATQGGVLIVGSLCFLITNRGNLQQFVYADGFLSTISHLQEYMRNEFVLQRPQLLLGGVAVFAIIGFLFQRYQAKANV